MKRILYLLAVVIAGAWVGGVILYQLLWLNPILEGTGKAGLLLFGHLWLISIIGGGLVSGYLFVWLFPKKKAEQP